MQAKHKSGCYIQFDGPCNCKEEPFKCASCGAESTNGEKPCDCVTKVGFRDGEKCVFKEASEQPDDCRVAFERDFPEYDLERDGWGDYKDFLTSSAWRGFLSGWNQRQPVRESNHRPGDLLKSSDSDFPGWLVAVPLQQMKDIKYRFKKLTSLGQTHYKAFDTQHKDVTALKGEVFGQGQRISNRLESNGLWHMLSPKTGI